MTKETDASMIDHDDLEDTPGPEGQLSLKLVATPKDTNLHGDISAGWVVSQMEQAAELAAARLAKGRTATVALTSMDFLCPVRLGSLVQVHSQLLETGTSSMKINIEVWILPPNEKDPNSLYKVTEATFVMVALDDKGRIRTLPSN
ncbi:MAG TPA: hotdog domain-containing protein [Marinospirillum sp.]|uniref:acyl-CoA thioesterase n=1 Tax=Marinospirillum sp. TaxID=2183934 RepID=UPI002B476451|nr:hotdog domain-containing protein [Marinospirillum sp.]HKM14664.1 hotdog domain-containing protein [Marinospirillum sp.]